MKIGSCFFIGRRQIVSGDYLKYRGSPTVYWVIYNEPKLLFEVVNVRTGIRGSLSEFVKNGGITFSILNETIAR